MSQTQTVNLRAAGNVDQPVIGTAELENLPDDRYPGDLTWLRPLIVCHGRYFMFVPQPSYGPAPRELYAEVVPVFAQRVAFTQAQPGPQ